MALKKAAESGQKDPTKKIEATVKERQIGGVHANQHKRSGPPGPIHRAAFEHALSQGDHQKDKHQPHHQNGDRPPMADTKSIGRLQWPCHLLSMDLTQHTKAAAPHPNQGRC